MNSDSCSDGLDSINLKMAQETKYRKRDMADLKIDMKAALDSVEIVSNKIEETVTDNR